MSYTEYLDMFLSAQENPNALYYVISFDVVNSKSMPGKERRILQININKIIEYVYNKLLEREKELKIQILIKDKRFNRPWDKTEKSNGNFIDPNIFGDTLQFTILRNTISKDEIIEWVNECTKKLKIEISFHIADAYYETNEYHEGNTKYYRGYCLQTLESFHKEQTQKQLQKIKKNS